MSQRQGVPRHIKLDPRLQAAYDMVPPCGICADIGADHGRLSAVLLLKGKARCMLVSDISAKALQKAQRLLGAFQLTQQAIFVVADGLRALDALAGDPAEVVCMLGMGGETLAGILARGKEKLQAATLVLGAQTELPLLRQAVQAIGYRIQEERVAKAADHFYVLMAAIPAQGAQAAYSPRELYVGPCLLAGGSEQAKAYFHRRQQWLTQAVTAMQMANAAKDEARLAQAQQELGYLQEALAAWEELDGSAKK